MLISTDFNLPLLSKDFSIIIFLAWIKSEFFISSVLIFFPTWRFLEFVISFVVKFSLTFISPTLFKLFTSILLLSILFEFIKLLAFKFSFTKIFFKLLILFENKLLLIISPEFVNSWFVITFAEIFPLLNIPFVKILSLRIFPLEFILFFISNISPWTIDVFVKFWEFIVFPANNFPLFVITPEFTLFITMILPLLSKLLLFKFLERISELIVLFTTLLELMLSFILILFEFSKLIVIKFSLETSPKLFKLFTLIFFESNLPELEISVVTISFALKFPEFIILFENTFSSTTTLLLFSISLTFKLVEEILPEFFKSPEIDISLFVEIRFELSTFPFILISLLACICPEFFVFLLSILIAFSATSLSPISVSVDDIFISPFAWVSFKYTLPFDEITTSPFVA